MAEKISEIKMKFLNTKTDSIIGYEEERVRELLSEYSTDDRSGVTKIVDKYKKILENLKLERLRIEKLKEFENKYSDYKYICGIDEVGRGPLAGPVCAGAVILDKDYEILYLNDSKQLSSQKREQLYDEIMEHAVAVKTALVTHKVIDEINILQSTYRAMRAAISELSVKPDILLNDAVNIPEVDIKQVAIVKGDARSVSIAAASIVAKVERDRLMEQYAELYPEYHFESNKGYGTKDHIEALKKYGPCPIHRMTFIKNV